MHKFEQLPEYGYVCNMDVLECVQNGEKLLSLSNMVNETDMMRLVEAGPLHTKEEIADFLDAEEDERALIIESYRLSGVAKTVDGWDKFLSVAETILAIAGGVATIAGAISGVYSVAHL